MYLFTDILEKKAVILMSKTSKLLAQMGEQIRLTRMRRKPSVAIGIYAAVIHAINGFDTDLHKVVADDELEQKLRDGEHLKKYHKEDARNAPSYMKTGEKSNRLSSAISTLKASKAKRFVTRFKAHLWIRCKSII